MKKYIVLIFLFVVVTGFAQKTILNDTIFIKELRSYIDNLYNFEFDNCDAVYDRLSESYPNHPFPDLYYALVIYWRYFPVTLNSEKEPDFLEKINSSISKAEKYFQESPSEESVFFNLMGRMLVMQYFADNQTSSSVIPHLKPAYKMLVKGFELEDEFGDFKFSSGVYNYYREFYPKAHPIYKPLAYFFPKGDSQKGIKQLEINSRKGIFLHKESLSFLVYISMYFEQDYKETLKYARKLKRENSGNLLYQSYYIQALLLQGKYQKAKEQIHFLEESPHQNNFFKTLATLYTAIIQEKKYENTSKAQKLYTQALSELEPYGNFVSTYKSIALFGLSRTYSKSDNKKSIQYGKEAKNVAIFPHINFD